MSVEAASGWGSAAGIDQNYFVFALPKFNRSSNAIDSRADDNRSHVSN